MISLIRRLSTLIAFGCLALTTVHAQDLAKSWPSKPLRIVVGFPAGSVTDTVARVMAEQLAKSLGQPVVVENKPGAGGVVAAETVLKAEPDGHTFVLSGTSSIVTRGLAPNGQPWRVGLPGRPGAETQASMSLQDESLSISAIWGKKSSHQMIIPLE